MLFITSLLGKPPTDIWFHTRKDVSNCKTNLLKPVPVTCTKAYYYFFMRNGTLFILGERMSRCSFKSGFQEKKSYSRPEGWTCQFFEVATSVNKRQDERKGFLDSSFAAVPMIFRVCERFTESRNLPEVSCRHNGMVAIHAIAHVAWL